MKGIVEQLREVLKHYDEGLITEGEVSSHLVGKLINEHVERAAKGEESGWFTSVCGGEDVPPIRCVIEIAPGRPAWFKPLPPYYVPEPVWPDENAKVWGVFTFGFHKDAIVPPADSPKWNQPGGVGYKDISFTRAWCGTKAEAEKLVDEMNSDPARRLLGNTRVVRPVPANER